MLGKTGGGKTKEKEVVNSQGVNMRDEKRLVMKDDTLMTMAGLLPIVSLGFYGYNRVHLSYHTDWCENR